jgi:tetratricopeptide (TPR) repeat protein
VQLINVSDGKPVWAASFDENFTHIFAIQDAVSAQVAQALSLKLTGDEKSRLAKRHTQDVEAYQSFIKGIYFWNQRTEDGIRRSIEHFKRAVELDASYAPAYAGLADAYGMAGYYAYETIGKREDVYKEARALAVRALQLDDGIAEAHVVMALVKSEFENDIAGAEQEYKRALELNPGSALAHHRYSVLLLRGGRINEADVESKKASDLDPLSMVVSTSHCSTLYFKRAYDEAATCSRRALEMHPDSSQALLLLGLSLGQQGRYDESIPPLRKMRELSASDTDIEALRSLGHVYALSGKKQEARKILLRLDGLSEKHDEALLSKALIHSALGEMDQVFAALEKRAPHWWEEPVGLRIDPRYDHIKADPRYAELLKRCFG